MASVSFPKIIAKKCYQSALNFDPFIPSEIVHLLTIAVISVFFLRQGFKSLNRMFGRIVLLTWTVLSTTPFTVMCVMIISSRGRFPHTGLLNTAVMCWNKRLQCGSCYSQGNPSLPGVKTFVSVLSSNSSVDFLITRAGFISLTHNLVYDYFHIDN